MIFYIFGGIVYIINNNYAIVHSVKCTNPQDNKKKIGVQITPFVELYEKYKKTGSKIYIRKIGDNNNITDEKLKQIHDVVYDKPYDINVFDWILAFFRRDVFPQKTDRFWCSALVGYIFTMIGVLKKDTDWSIMYPSDFALDGENLNYENKDKNILQAVEYLLNIDK